MEYDQKNRKKTNSDPAMERAMLNNKKINRIRTQKIRRKLLYRKDLIQTIRNQYWNWAGHVIRLQDNRWKYLITFWYLKKRMEKG